VRPCVHETARVMKTLMRNGRDRRPGNPVEGHARKERVLLVGTRSADHIRASGHSGRTQRPDTWLHPNASLNRKIPPAPRAPSIHGPLRRLGHRRRTSALERIASSFAAHVVTGRYRRDSVCVRYRRRYLRVTPSAGFSECLLKARQSIRLFNLKRWLRSCRKERGNECCTVVSGRANVATGARLAH
jgi:hypothetical protein